MTKVNLAEEYWKNKEKIKSMQALQDKIKETLKKGLTEEKKRIGRFELRLIKSESTTTLWESMTKDGIDIEKYKLKKEFNRFDLRIVK